MSYLHKRRKKLFVNILFVVTLFVLALTLTVFFSKRRQYSPASGFSGLFMNTPIQNGDADANSKVDFSDVVSVLKNWGMNADGAVDQYADGKINSLDFAVVSSSIPK